MLKPLKRLLPFTMCAVIAVSSVSASAATASTAPSAAPSPDFAAGVSSEPAESGMETALVAVKSLINIDDSVYTDFSYNSSYTNYQTREGLVWYFSWSDMKNRHISASAAADGTLLSFYKYDYEQQSYGFASVSKSDAATAAAAFIKKANPDTHSYYKTPDDTYINLSETDYSFTYYAQIDGYRFDAARINVRVNKHTGEISAYDTSNIIPANFKFENTSSIISRDDAIKAYADKIGLSLEYYSYYDYTEKQLKIFPVYLPKSAGDKYIGAVTGDIVEYVYDRALAEKGMEAPTASADMAMGGTSAENARASLSPAELSAIDKVKGFITGEQALANLLEAAGLSDLDTDTFENSSTYLNSDYYENDRYFYNINMYSYSAKETMGGIAGIYGRVDAETGRVYSFSYDYLRGDNSDDTVSGYTEAQAQKDAEAFLQKIAPSEYAKSKLENKSTPADRTYDEYYDGYYSFFYVRYENGIPFKNNGINVSINSRTGKITSYSLNWFETVSFPSVSSVLSQTDALKAYVSQNGSKLNFVTVGNGSASLVYDFSGQGYIDPFSGKALDYTGKPWEDTTVKTDYSDVTGHWSESYVTKLSDNGANLWSGKFEPDKAMTVSDFLRYIALAEPYVYEVRPLDFAKERGITTDTKLDDTTPLTRAEAARMVAEYLGYGELASRYEWFKYPYSDNAPDEYKGYITICHMLGIVTGADGIFDADSGVTRAQAAVMLHNLILFKSRTAS